MKQLKSIIIECSFANATPENRLFGHLRPSDLLQLLNDLKQAKQQANLDTIQIIVFHTKPTLNNEPEAKNIIAKELQNNEFKISLVNQGDAICLK